jgi:hypothetical protein
VELLVLRPDGRVEDTPEFWTVEAAQRAGEQYHRTVGVTPAADVNRGWGGRCDDPLPAEAATAVRMVAGWW